MPRRSFRNSWFGLVALVIASLSASLAVAQANNPPTAPKIQPAVDGVLAAFATHPLVSIGEHHGLAQDGDFYNALVLDPRFASDVGNVVVEFGSAAHQDTLDRYLAGENVPYPELREVWTDLVGTYPAALYVMYPAFFAQVRRANLNLPPEKRIKVWLGDPGVDFTRVKIPEDQMRLSDRRDAIAVDLIERQILAHGKKALLIYGFPHFHNVMLQNGRVTPYESIGVLLDRKHPGSLFRVEGYAGVPDRRCGAAFENRIRDWPRGSLVSPVKGTWLVAAMYGPRCKGLPYMMSRPGANRALTDQQLAPMQQAVRDTLPDAFIYFGPEASLTQSPITPEIYMDPAYVAELSRRSEVMTGQPLTSLQLTEWATRNADLYDTRFPQLRDK